MSLLAPEFLKSGALLTLDSGDSGRIWLGCGPWARSPNLPASTPALYQPDFFLKSRTPWAVPSRSVVIDRNELRGWLKPLAESVSLPEWRWSRPEYARFEHLFGSLQEYFAKGELTKGVPVVFERAMGEVSEPLLAAFVLSLLENAGEARVYGFWDQGQGWVGATPEDLFVSEGLSLRTMALAGTRARGEGAAEALSADPKERREHECVVEDIRNVLTSFGEVKIGETCVHELPSLLHLKTAIEVHVSESVDYPKIIRALHPTAALGAFPREAGWNWLQKMDQGECPPGRENFGAPFGLVLSPDSAIFVVAIRNLQWKDRELRIGSGCGVIAESICENEWQELSDKRESVKRMLGLCRM